MTHGPHPSISEHGLANGCERCAEIAINPFAGMDTANLATLVERTRRWMRDEEFPRSIAEAVAMGAVEDAIRRADILAALPVPGDTP